MTTKNTICWVSIDPWNGNTITYPESQTIEEAYQNKEDDIFLENFTRTIHFKDCLHQTTPAVGNKPKGYRSVIRGNVGDKVKVFYWICSKRWYLYPPSYYTDIKEGILDHIESKPEIWQWCDKIYEDTQYALERNWHNYAPEFNTIIEETYKSHTTSVDLTIGLTKYSIHSFRGAYARQENMQSGITRAIRRGCTPTPEITLPDHLQDESCALCMDSFADTPELPIKKTKCNHSFHWTCINGYKTQNTGDPKCPLCRAPLKF